MDEKRRRMQSEIAVKLQREQQEIAPPSGWWCFPHSPLFYAVLLSFPSFFGAMLPSSPLSGGGAFLLVLMEEAACPPLPFWAASDSRRVSREAIDCTIQAVG